MGARAGRKGSRTYNILTCGVGSWRKYLDKKRRKAAKQFAIDEELKAWQQAAAEAYYRVEKELEKEQQCICGLVTPNPKACQCGCGFCCPPDCECEEEEMPDPESVGNESQEETEAGIDRMYEKLDPTPTVDLEEVRTLLDRLACSELPQPDLMLLVKLADEVELGNSAINKQITVNQALREENAQMREALEKISVMTVTHRTSVGWNQIGESALAALEEDNE